MTKVTELPNLEGFNAGSTATFIVVDNKLVRRLSYTNLRDVLAQSLLGTEQQLTPTSNVRFQSVTAFLGSFTNVQIRNNLEVGGSVDNDFKDGSIYLTNEQLVPRNTTLLMRGFKNNYINTGPLHPVVVGQMANNNHESPVAVVSDDNLFTVASGGYTGRTFTDFRGKYTGRLTFFATENWGDTLTSSTNVGTGFYIATHPNGVILDRSQDFQQMHIRQFWENESGYAVSNLTIGSGIQGSKDLIRSDGNILTHEGVTKLKFLNTRFTLDGVVPEDTGPENNTLLASNAITLLGARRSASSNRRDAVAINDTIGKIEVRGMHVNSATLSNSGLTAGDIKFVALENFSSTASGTRLVLSTVNSGTVIASARLSLTNRENTYISNSHRFLDSQGNVIGVISTGTDTTVLSTRQVLSTSSITLIGGNTATTVMNGFKSYLLSKVQTTQAAWVRIYSDSASQLADYFRPIVDDPPVGINLLTEVVTTAGGLTQVIAPGIFGFNNENPVTNMIYITITNNTSTVAPITATLTMLKVEL